MVDEMQENQSGNEAQQKDDVNIDQIAHEVEQAEQQKTQEIKEQLKEEVKTEVKSEVASEVKEQVKQELTTEQKLAEIEKKLEETLKMNEQLNQKLKEQEEIIESLPAQRKGFINNQNPMGSKRKPTEQDIYDLIDKHAVDKEAAIRKSLGL